MILIGKEKLKRQGGQEIFDLFLPNISMYFIIYFAFFLKWGDGF